MSKSCNVLARQHTKLSFLTFATHQPWHGTVFDMMLTRPAATGDNEQALKWCEKGLSERTTAMVWLRVDPVYDPLRSDVRFQALLAKVGLD